MIRVEPNAQDFNEFELLQVIECLNQNNVKYATVRPGNNCIWVTQGVVDSYYIFRGGRLVDIQVD